MLIRPARALGSPERQLAHLAVADNPDEVGLWRDGHDELGLIGAFPLVLSLHDQCQRVVVPNIDLPLITGS